MKRIHTVLAAGAMLAFAASPVHAKVYALVVGIDDYAHEDRLFGAVADANDIDQALRKFGIRNIKKLVNREATRDSIVAEWKSMMAQAKGGDTIFWSYAGHGGQEPTRRPDIEGPNGKDEAILLSGFDRRSEQGKRDRIVDKEINLWFKQAGAKGVRVVFVADACHAAGLTRSWGGGANGGVTYRSAPPYGTPALQLSAEQMAGEVVKIDDLPNVTFFAATQKNLQVPEVLIAGRKRGALSWAFSRALEGQVPRNQKGALTFGAMQSYMVGAIKQASDRLQIPEFAPRSSKSDTEVMVADEDPTPATGGAEVALAPRNGVTGLFILNATNDRSAQIVKGLRNVQLTPQKQANFTWDAQTEQLFSEKGDIVAHKVPETALNGAIEKWRTVDQIKEMVLQKPLDVSIVQGDQVHRTGNRVQFKTEPVKYKYITAINIDPHGIVQFLYPALSTDPKELPAGQSFQTQADVRPEFGADHLIVIASSKPLYVLHDQVKAVHVKDLKSYLAESLKGSDYQIGLAPLFTAP